MSDLNGKSCKAAYMHEGMFLPGVGDISKELVVGSVGDKQVKSIVIDEPFVIVTLLSNKSRREYVMPVPTSNFKFLVLNDTIMTTPPLK